MKDTKKVLIIGTNGMLGRELTSKLRTNYEYIVYTTTLDTLDICKKEEVYEKIKEISPNFVVNCAAYTNVDACETNVDLCNNVNGHALANIADACNNVDATLIHISTDYVCDGELDLSKIYTEDMPVNPVNQYGRGKLIGEENCRKCKKHYILRTAWLYGDGNNFVRTMIRLSKEKEFINVVNDQYGSPTSTTTLSEIIEQIMIKEPEYGIYNATNEGFITWYEFTKKIFEILDIKIPVNPVNSSDFVTAAKRPTNSKLSKEKLNKVGIFPKKYEDALCEYLKKEGMLK